MARKLKFDEKTVVVHSKIRELEILYKRYGLFEAAIPAMALRQSLTFEERAALADFESKFWEKAAETNAATLDAQAAARIYNERLRSKNPDQRLGVIPDTNDIPSIVSQTVDGGQQSNKGRELKRRLELLEKGNINRWLDDSAFSEEVVIEHQEWAATIIEDSWGEWKKFRDFTQEQDK